MKQLSLQLIKDKKIIQEKYEALAETDEVTLLKMKLD
jgi:hypothetical protein